MLEAPPVAGKPSDIQPEDTRQAEADATSAKAFVAAFHRDVGVTLGEPDFKKIEKVAEQKPDSPIVDSVEGVPISEIAKRKRESAGEPAQKPQVEKPEPAKADTEPTKAKADDSPKPEKAVASIPPTPSPRTATAPATAQPEAKPKPVTATEAVETHSDFENSLLPEQREELEFDRAAERLMPDKYKDVSAKRLKFFKQLDEFAAQHPDLTADSEELTQFIEKHKPTYPAPDVRKLERLAVKEEVLAEAQRATDEKLASANREIQELKTRPRIAAEIEALETDLAAMLPENMRTTATEKGLDELDGEFPLEGPIVRQVIDNTVLAANEFLELATGLKPYQQGDPAHEWLVRFINTQGQVFQKQGGDALVRDGKQFVPRSEYSGDPATWTFSNREVTDMLKANAKINMDNLLADATKKHELIASKRQKSTVEQKPNPQTEAQPSPRARNSPSPGIGQTAQEPDATAGLFQALGVTEKPT